MRASGGGVGIGSVETGGQTKRPPEGGLSDPIRASEPKRLASVGGARRQVHPEPSGGRASLRRRWVPGPRRR